MAKITGKDLLKAGWDQGPEIGVAIRVGNAYLAASNAKKPQALDVLNDVRHHPANYSTNPDFAGLATLLVEVEKRAQAVKLHNTPIPYRTWGIEGIERAAITQMNNAMRLPVAIAGALMPDAHVGYGLPIGGVLATSNHVIPFAIGVDIACRMRLSIFPDDPSCIDDPAHSKMLQRILLRNTYFGVGAENDGLADHPVLDDEEWGSTPFLRVLHATAAKQIGTSGSGNHFAEFGILQIVGEGFKVGSTLIESGRYLALLTHGGSRGVGHKIAQRYSKIASIAVQESGILDASVKDLAWLDLDHEAGIEYWRAMGLAGRFASANHAVIHNAVARDLGSGFLAVVENHHNFAWIEKIREPNGYGHRTAIVHRKGATPAGKGQLGVIPGTMGDIGFVVRGLGDEQSLNSASHGAGRRMSRTAAKRAISCDERDAYLAENNVVLLGGDLDEAPQAYKPIAEVMAHQYNLVETEAIFTPRIVRMAEDKGGDI